MIYYTAILDESQIAIVVNDMYWCNEMGGVLLADFYVLVFADVIPVEVHTWAFAEKALVAAELLVVVVLDLHFKRLQLPYVLP